MFQLRIHGRRGQGVVTAAELVSVAAIIEGRHAQALPSFGSKRTGAPVVAFCRIHDKEIRVREPIAEPDALIVQDPTLPHQVYVFGGVGPDGYILINSARSFEDLGLGDFAERFHRNRCPDNAVLKLADSADANVNGYAIDLDYCQGCGICASECPCGAIRMEPEAI